MNGIGDRRPGGLCEERLTLEQKIGQMVMMGVPGTEAGTEAAALIREYNVGGIMFFAENVVTPAQVQRFTADLQQLARTSGAGWPLFISIDQEGGRVVRIKEGVTPLPSAMALGAAGSEQLAEKVGRIVGEELAALGINMNAAPVLDVNNNPHNPVIGTRSFGEDPHAVAKLGTAFMRGLQAAGLLAIGKHFPGHGDTDVDSHLALPTIAHARERLNEVELVPFRAAIDAGIDAVMSAHITFPTVDPTPGLPSTLSPRVLTGLLRGELGFGGLIVTDALEMSGITSQFSIPDAAVKAVLAGADIVLVAQSKYNEDGKRAVERLVQAVRDGIISEQRIDESVRRIAEAKQRLAVRGAQERSDASARSLAVVQEAAWRAVTVVRDDAGLLPLSTEKVGCVLVVSPPAAHGVVAAELRRRFDRVDEMGVALEPDAEALRSVVVAADRADVIVAATMGTATTAAYAELVKALHATGRPLIAVCLGEPYDLAAFPGVSTYVAAYGEDALHVAAAVDVIAGHAPAVGRLPVSIPGMYPVGHAVVHEERFADDEQN